MEFREIVDKFDINGEFISCEPYGDGHINDTYLVTANDNGNNVNYILQGLNSNVFPRTKELMENVAKVTAFLAEQIKARGGNPLRETLTLIDTKDGEKYFVDDKGKFFRMYVFIADTVGLPLAESAEVFEGAGKAFGDFISGLNDFDARELHEVIFNFHNTEERFKNFLKGLDKDYENRSFICKPEIEFVLNRKDYCGKVVELLRRGELPLRVTHNDTKLNNVLMDKNTLKPVAVIDLDTIMPGSLLYDFGDAIRSGCNTGLEDEKDLSKVGFDIGLFEAFTRGFLGGIGENITSKERELLPFGAILMTFECGMRFLNDYLDGDNYFRTHYPEHNLVRARTQFKLVADMEQCLDQMNAIVKKY